MRQESIFTGLILGSGIGIGLFLGFAIGFERSEVGYERTLYNHDLGTYNQKNGDFIPIWEQVTTIKEEAENEQTLPRD